MAKLTKNKKQATSKATAIPMPIIHSKVKIPLYEPYFDGHELMQLADCIESNWITGGKKVKEFERRMVELTGAKHAIACCNGTLALYIGLKIMGIGIGDKVIVPDFTFIASANSVVMAGAEPIFCDVDVDSLCMNRESIKKVLAPNTKAIMPVGIYGNSPNMDEICLVAEDYKLRIIEDSAQDISVFWNIKHLGTFGDVGCMSYYADKTLTCLPAETRILTILYKDGRGGSRTKCINDIKIGDDIVSYNEVRGVKELDTVTKVFERKVDELLLIKFDNGNELQITGNHPIYVVDKGWTKACEIKRDDIVLQYMYFGLNQRVNGITERGMKLEDRWGRERFNKWRKKHIKRLKQLHSDPNSKYSAVDLKARGLKISVSNKRFAETPKGKSDNKKRSIAMKQKYLDPNSIFSTEAFRKKRLEASIIANQRPESREKKSIIGKRNWQNKEYRDMVIKRSNAVRGTKEYLENYARGLAKKPNKTELRLEGILQSYCPNEFAYNGDYRLGISVGWYIPDFVNINGKKKVIDLFGNYWHDVSEVKVRVDKMALLGWDCLVIWESELSNLQQLEEKIKTFIYNPKIKLVKVKGIKKIKGLTKVYNIQTVKNNNYFAYGILVHNCGEGGMIFTDSDEMAEKAIKLMNQGRTKRGWYVHETIGFNFRMTDLQAAIGLAQLDKLPEIIVKKKEHETLYRMVLSDIRQIKFPKIDERCFNVPFRHNILVPNPEALSKHLTRAGIGNLRFFYPLHKQPCYKYLGCDDSVFPNTMKAYDSGLSLPSSVKLTDGEIFYICAKIREFYR